MINNEMIDNNNLEYNNILGNNDLPQDFQFMNNNDLMAQMQGNFDMFNNMNNMNDFNVEEGQDNFGQK